jgi:hypothetical protein
MELFPSFPDHSQVWIYAANRFFEQEEVSMVQKVLNDFTASWAAHGTEIKASSAILFRNFVVIVANESSTKASGCSIDSSVRFIKEIGAKLNIDFFNRLLVLIEKEGEFKRIHFSELKANSEWNMFNPMVKTLGEMRTNWFVPVGESSFV